VALSKLTADSFDLTDNYAFTGTVTPGGSTQKLFLIKNLDASGNTTRTFIDGSSSVDLDNTYKTYLFRFINVHPVDDQVKFEFQGSTQGASSSDGDYATAITSTFFHAYHTEDGSSAALGYETAGDLGQGTGFQSLGQQVGNANDECISGELFLFNPSSTTFVKHFLANTNRASGNAFSVRSYISGYANTTSAVNAVQFKFDSGNIDSGRIALYGIK